MPTAELSPSAVPAAPAEGHSSPAWKSWLPLALFALLWVDLCRQLSYTWDNNEQYAFGWFVPFLALGMLFRRWETPPASNQAYMPIPRRHSLWLVVAVVLALAYLPLRVIHEINQDWPLISWPMAFIAVGLSLIGLQLWGGPTTVRHYGFPIVFALTALQWPYRIENSLIHTLMPAVTTLTVEILGLFGIVAMERGNIIELTHGVLGVDEACSGIRSFQSTFMGTLFFGEIYRLPALVRILLVGAGLATAFLLNIARTLFLSWQANENGLSAVDRWHDPAGYTIAIASYAILWLIAVSIARFTKSAVPVQSPTPTAAPLPPPTSRVAPQRYLLLVGTWAVTCFITMEAWYRSHERTAPTSTSWWVAYPTNLPSFRALEIPKTAKELLKYNHAATGAWTEPDGSHWSVFAFRWDAGDPTARISAQGHRPEYCMVGSGHEMHDMSEIRYLDAAGIRLPYRLYTFRRDGQLLHVFFALWEDGAEHQAGFGLTNTGDRLRAVLDGRRNTGQQTFEVIALGYATDRDADTAIKHRLRSLLTPSPESFHISRGAPDEP